MRLPRFALSLALALTVTVGAGQGIARAQEAAPIADAPPPPPAAPAGGDAGVTTEAEAAPAADAAGDPGIVAEAVSTEPKPTDAVAIVEEVILPAAERRTAAAIALQNAVLRHCRAPDDRAVADVERAFADAVVAAGEAEPHAFGAEAHRNVPALITTEVENTAFSRSRLEAIMNARIAPPATLADLAVEEPGLTGLPALERLLLLPPYEATATKVNRCRLAIPIVANVRATAYVVEERWRRRTVDPQWTADEPELADRLRLRDLIQAMIDVSDRLDRDVTQFAPDPLGNGSLPFASKRRMEMYLAAVSGALMREALVVSRFAPASSPAHDALDRVAAALEQGRVLLPASDAERGAAAELFDRAQQEIAQLPAAFDFAPAAFQRPLASFEPTEAPSTAGSP